MKKIKCFSSVRLKDGRTGSIVDVYESPVLGYGIDFVTDYRPEGPFPDEIYDIVKPEDIVEILWEPKD